MRIKPIIMTGLAFGCLFGAASADSHSSWADKITMSGDLRFRHERIDKDESSVRSRQRVRARIGISAEVDDELDVHFRIASGSEDPVSTNQTLDGGFSSKGINLDRAYFDWHPEALGGLSIWGGKMKNPFMRVQDLIWDSDLNPEGVALKWTCGGEDMSIHATAAGFWGEERSSASDTFMWGGQVAMKTSAAGANILAGVSYYLWDEIDGNAPLFDSTDGFGNTIITDATGASVYQEEYGSVNAFLKASFDVGMPLAVYADWVYNTEADVSDEDQGYMVGATVGKAKKKGSWQLDYNFRQLEADAAVGAFVDSDSGGGGTDLDGHKIKGKYQMSDHWQMAVSVFVNELGIASNTNTDYNRVMVDAIAKF